MADAALPPIPLLTSGYSVPVSYSTAQLNGILASSANLVDQLAIKVVSYISSILDQAVATYTAAAAKVAAPIVTGLNQAQATVGQLGSAVASGLATQLTVATAASATGSTAALGAVPGQYAYNVWQDYDTPASIAITHDSAEAPSTAANWCFLSGWDDYYDAIKAKGVATGQPPPPGCALPGGPAVHAAAGTPGGGGPPPCPSGLYQVYQIVVDSKITGCGVSCWPAPLPSNISFFTDPIPWDQVEGLLQSILCTGAPPPPPPPPGAVSYYAGCINGQVVTWQSNTSPPAGVSGIVGPFATLAEATAAAQCAVTPPPSGGGPPAGTCVCVTGSEDACLYVDLCDWQKFIDAMTTAIYQGMCKFIKDPACRCDIFDDTRWALGQCDGDYATIEGDWAGEAGSYLSMQPDDLLASATSLLTLTTVSSPPTFSGDPNNRG